MNYKHIFTQNTLHCSFIPKKNCALDPRRFQKDWIFTTFLPNFTEDEECNISNKYRSRKNLQTH